LAITHTFVSAVADGADATLVRPSNWNADHTIAAGTITAAQLSFDVATQAELDAHAAAADPHTGYRLESADHTHASSGAQGGLIATLQESGGPTTLTLGAIPATTILARNGTNIVGLASGDQLGPPIILYQGSDATRNNNTTLLSTDLVFPGAANGIYAVALHLFYTSGTTPDIKFGMLGTATTTGSVGLQTVATTTTGLTGDVQTGRMTNFTTPGTIARGGGGALGVYCPGGGIIRMGATGGTVTLQFAQQTADASDTVFLADSHMMVWKV
jgi:hypothetical protein